MINKTKETNAYRRKIQMLKKSKSSLANPTSHSNQTNVKQPNLQTKKNSGIKLDFDNPYESQNAEEIAHLEMQKKLLSNKLSQLSADYALEDQKRRQLEDEVAKARKNATNNYYHDPGIDETQTKLQSMESQLEKAQSQFNSNLQRLASLRSQLTAARKARHSDNSNEQASRSTQSDKNDQETTDEMPNENFEQVNPSSDFEVHELQPNEREDILNYIKYNDQLAQSTASNYTSKNKNSFQISSSIPSHLMTPEISEIVQQTETYQNVINKILAATNMKDVLQLLTETEQLEKENKRLYESILQYTQVKDDIQEEIAILQNQYHDLVHHRNSTEEEQRKEIQRITTDLAAIQSELEQAEIKKKEEEEAFNPVYAQLEHLFNALDCSWDDWSGGKNTVTTANAMYAMNTIEATIAELMNDPASKSKVLAQMRKMQEEEEDKTEKDNKENEEEEEPE